MTSAVDIESASRAVRFQRAGLKVDGVEFDLRKYPFLIEPFDIVGTVPRITVRKGGQLGYTAMMVLCTIDLACYVYSRGILYMMPTRDDAHDFSRSRFKRLMDDNHKTLGARVKGTNSITLKRIGDTFMYFRGSKSRSQLKSIPCDLLVCDERDEMSLEQVLLARGRLDGSDFQHEIDFSTPTLPEFGVDASYAESDQRMWHVKCEACSQWTCLDLEFPECLVRRADGVVNRICVKCQKPMRPNTRGEHVPAHPDRSKDHIGYHVSQLYSPRIHGRTLLEEWEDAKESGGAKLREYKNTRLGIGHADTEDIMTAALLKEVVSADAVRFSAQGPCFLGADIGGGSEPRHHFFVGQRTGERMIEILRYGTVGWAELHDLWERYNVHVGVLDSMAETAMVRKFCDTHAGAYGCWYSENQRIEYNWDHMDRKVTVLRTELLDESHKEVVQKRVKFPRPGEEWDKFVKQMGNLARKAVFDNESGTPKIRWVLRGRKNDHYRHAWAYTVLASTRAPIAARARRIITPSSHSSNSWMVG